MAKDRAEQMRKIRAERKVRGLVKVCGFVPEAKREELKKIIEALGGEVGS